MSNMISLVNGRAIDLTQFVFAVLAFQPFEFVRCGSSSWRCAGVGSGTLFITNGPLSNGRVFLFEHSNQ